MVANGVDWCERCCNAEPTLREEFFVIEYLLGGIVVLFLLVLTYGGLTGRVRARAACCCPADPDKDLRMRTPDQGSETLRSP